jgi:hypothetical protein
MRARIRQSSLLNDPALPTVATVALLTILFGLILF